MIEQVFGPSVLKIFRYIQSGIGVLFAARSFCKKNLFQVFVSDGFVPFWLRVKVFEGSLINTWFTNLYWCLENDYFLPELKFFNELKLVVLVCYLVYILCVKVEII